MGLAVALAGGLALTLGSTAGAYRTGPPAAHTGGFGEPTCATCHYSDAGPGELVISGPDAYTPGEAHELRVTLRDPDMRAGGFQLSARFAAGDGRGTQAGAFQLDDGLAVVTAGGVEYVGHDDDGVRYASGHEPAEWRIRWTAPAEGGAVRFHAAANAANDDDSEFGDRVHTASLEIPPAGAGEKR